jgi:superfamily II DNA or RNA helicase
MAISLFAHNQDAYKAAIQMLHASGKAAVIHPTGTGKSSIAFKLCEDFPDKTVCWLSPSEYIFRTQMENLKKATGGSVPTNIQFFTYARLMNMHAEEIKQIQPDYIVLDEFHRCGAQMWGQGVQNLLTAFAETPVLGLSATAIRYLDNQRDMADELFDGNVASEMTLGEAIVRGILNPPKYVLSVFSYRKDLEKYEKRVQGAKSKAVREESAQYLEALRRALEKAEGLDQIFYKHMENHAGKYIVFCANFDHMQDMIALAPQWFAKVDSKPHIYSAYSDDPETDKAFAAFKQDNSDRLKLLYCIDMLNEGIHVDDVDGVILLRPTVSPIIYKQQIGRALSAGKKKNAVIFDVVLNIENLYSIGAVEEEMQIAATYYRSLGLEGEIVNEQFRVIDEVRDCMELFEKLNDSLSASWSLMYHYAQAYAQENGNLDVPKRYVTQEGYSLGTWLHTQRQVYSGKIAGTLTQAQIDLLNNIGMRWESARDLSWERNYAAAKQYYEEHGNLLVNVRDEQSNGVALGRWIAQLRFYRKSGIQSAYMTPERIKALDAIGMVWDVPDYLWERNYYAAMCYHRTHGHLNVPADYVDGDGIRLGAWLRAVRSWKKGQNKRAELTEEQVARLDALGMNWAGKYDTAWETAYAEACQYKQMHGDLNVPSAYVADSGVRLGRWIRNQREAYKTTLSAARKQKLDALGMVWQQEDPWNAKFRLVEQYYKAHGHTKMPADYVVEGVWLRRWLSEQKARLNGKPTGSAKTVKPLTPEQVKLLESVGIQSEEKQLDIA